MILLRMKVNLSAMAMKGYTAFHKATALQEPQHLIVLFHIQEFVEVVLYPSAEMQLVYSVALAYWAW